MADSAVTTQAVLRAAIDSAHYVLEATVGETSDEVANRAAPGNANPIGASYAHTVLAEDGVVNGMIRGQAPLLTTTWTGRTGTDKPMPVPGMVQGDIGEWYRTVRVDLAACREYAKAVYAQTADFIANADDATLARPMDMSSIGMGTIPMAVVFEVLVVGHCNNLCGEISAIKGVQGLRGYPF